MSVFLPQTLLENTAMSAPFCQDIAEFKAKLKAEIRGRPCILGGGRNDFVYLDTLENWLVESYQSEDNFNFYNFYI